MTQSEQSILLIYPGERIAKPRLPMSVLALASYCISRGYLCKIIDERIDVLRDDDIEAASIIGISTMSGMQLRSAIKTAKRIRRQRPDAVLVWGGAHPSSFPEQTAQSPLVDYVVKGEGEETFFQLCANIFNNHDVSDMPALSFKTEEKVINNPVSAQWLSMDDLPFPFYELFDIRRYADFEDGLSYESSRGCLFRCAFCYVEYFHKRIWRGKSVEKVIMELEFIQKRFGVKKIGFVDDNFFGDKERSLEICRQMGTKNLNFKWSATARADFLSRCSPEEMLMIQKSGCEILSIGAESGSLRVLSQIRKDILPQQIKDAVKKCIDYLIMPTMSFIIGLPFETPEDLEETLALYDELMAMGKNVEINGLFLYVPYAGTSLFDVARQHGYQPQAFFEKWSTWNFSDPKNNPWLSLRARGQYSTIATIARFKYLYHRFEFYSEEFKREKLKSPPLRFLYRFFIKPFAAVVDWRWQKRFFAFPIELFVWRKLTYLFFRIK